MAQTAWRNSEAEIFRDCFRSRLDAQLLVIVPDMGADGVDADSQPVPDLLASHPLGNAIEHRLFAAKSGSASSRHGQFCTARNGLLRHASSLLHPSNVIG